MQVSNWIMSQFAEGPDFVSDADTALAERIAAAIDARPVLGRAPEFGVCPLDAGDRALIYLRVVDAEGATFVHAVTCSAGEAKPPAYLIERAFARKYGDPVGPRARELMNRLVRIPISQATLALTDAFLDAHALEALGGAAEEAPPVEMAASTRLRRKSSAASSTLPWLIATAAVGVAGFLGGRFLATDLPAVSAAPPETALPALAAGDRGAAEMPLGEQLEYERRLHAEELAERQARIDELTHRLAAHPTDAASEAASDAAPSGAAGETEAQPEIEEIPPPRSSPADAIASVGADALWVRDGPGSEHRKLSRLGRDVEVVLEGTVAGDWSRIAKPTSGWVASKFLVPQEPSSAE